MLNKIKQKIDSKRDYKNTFWKTLILLKDLIYGTNPEANEVAPAGAKMQYISANAFRARCRTEWSYSGLRINEDIKNNLVFLNLDHIAEFFTAHKPKTPFILITNNSDSSVNESHKIYADDPLLIKWYAQNLDIAHYKLRGCPLGIVNYKNGCIYTPCGDSRLIDLVRSENNEKEIMLYSGFTTNTNRSEREKCLKATGINLSEKISFGDYLRNLSRSYFCLAPNGTGIDTHRVWESLYVKTIPIITKNKMADAGMYQGLPVIILDSWNDFKKEYFTAEKYHKIWNDFNIESLNVERFIPEMDSGSSSRLLDHRLFEGTNTLCEEERKS